MRISILIIFTFSFFSSFAQTLENEPESKLTETDSMLFEYCQVMPVLKTKEYSSFQDYLAKHIIYPKDAMAKRIVGIVYVQFIIEKDGSISNVSIVPGRGLYPSCDQEAVRVVSASPKWKSGVQDGKSVRIKMIQRIAFNLTGSK